MQPYCVATILEDEPGVAFTRTVMASSEEAAIRMVLSYLQLEFDLPPDAPYRC